MSSDIPQARRNIRAILDNGNMTIEQVRSILLRTEPLLYREKYKRQKAEPTSNTMTPELAEAIMDHLAQEPSASTKEIAEKFNVNQGRISECIKRYGH